MLVTAESAKHFLIPEQQIKPILAYLKAQIVQTYVFIEEKDFHQKEIVNADVYFRRERSVDDTGLIATADPATQAEREAKRASWSCLGLPPVTLSPPAGRVRAFLSYCPV